MESVKELMDFALSKLNEKVEALEEKNQHQKSVLKSIEIDVRNAEKDLVDLGCEIFPSEFVIESSISQSLRQFMAAKMQAQDAQESEEPESQDQSINKTSEKQSFSFEKLVPDVTSDKEETMTIVKEENQHHIKDVFSLSESNVVLAEYSSKSFNASALMPNNLSSSYNITKNGTDEPFFVLEDDSFAILEAKLQEKAALLLKKVQETKQEKDPEIIPTRATATTAPGNRTHHRRESNAQQRKSIPAQPKPSKESTQKNSLLDSSIAADAPLRKKSLDKSPLKVTPVQTTQELEKPTEIIKAVKSPGSKQVKNEMAKNYLASTYIDIKPLKFQDKYIPFAQRNGRDERKSTGGQNMLLSREKENVNGAPVGGNGEMNKTPTKERAPLAENTYQIEGRILNGESFKRNKELTETAPISLEKPQFHTPKATRVEQKSRSNSKSKTPTNSSQKSKLPPNQHLLNYYASATDAKFSP